MFYAEKYFSHRSLVSSTRYPQTYKVITENKESLCPRMQLSKIQSTHAHSPGRTQSMLMIISFISVPIPDWCQEQNQYTHFAWSSSLLLLRYFLFILWTNNRDHLLILLLMYSETWFWCPTLVEEIRRTKEQYLICLRIVGQDSMLSLAGGPKIPVVKVLKCSCRSLINISTLKNSRQENSTVCWWR